MRAATLIPFCVASPRDPCSWWPCDRVSQTKALEAASFLCPGSNTAMVPSTFQGVAEPRFKQGKHRSQLSVGKEAEKGARGGWRHVVKLPQRNLNIEIFQHTALSTVPSFNFLLNLPSEKN